MPSWSLWLAKSQVSLPRTVIVTFHPSHISLICVLSLSPQSECPPLHPCISASSSLSDTVFTATVCCCCHPFFPVCVYCLQAASMFPLPAPGLMIRITPSHCTPTPGLYPGHRSLATTNTGQCPHTWCPGTAQHTWHRHHHRHCPRDHLSLAAGCANVVCPRRRTACNWHYPPRPRQCGASQVRGRRMRSADQRPPPAQLGIAAEKSYYR